MRLSHFISTLILLLFAASIHSCAPDNTMPATGIDAEQSIPPSYSDMSSFLQAELARLGRDPVRQPAAAPEGIANMVFALSAHVDDPDGTGPLLPVAVGIGWYEVNAGDYNLDSQVNISDLTPLGINFNRSVAYDDASLHGGLEMFPAGNPLDDGGVPPGDPPLEGSGAANWKLARVDGNSDGIINISDITPIAQHWQQRLDGYMLYRRRPGEAEFSLLPNSLLPGSAMSVERSQLAIDPLRPVPYSYVDEDLGAATGIFEYLLKPFDSSSAREGAASVLLQVDLDSGSGGSNPPVAQLSANVTTGDVPLVVVFDASASYDPDPLGEITRYEWDTNNDPSVFEFDSGLTATMNVTYMLPGNYEQWVRVSDADGMSAETSLTITATSDNVFPVAELVASPATGTAPLIVELNASGSHDSDGSIVQFEFDPEGDGSFLAPTAVILLNHNYQWAGTYHPQVRVTDNEGASNTASTTVTLDGVPPQHDPVAHLTVDHFSGEAPLDVVLDASGSTDEDADITAYVWDLDGNGSFETWGGGTPLYSHTLTEVGQQTVSVQVKDSRNASDSASISIEVLPGAEFWHIYPADTTTSGSKISISLIDAAANPALAYFDEQGEDVIYTRATDSLGTEWGTPFAIVSNISQWGGDVDLAVVNGNPAVTYHWGLNAFHGYVCFKRSDDAFGNLWLTPEIIAGGAPTVNSTSCSLTEVGGRPAIAYLDMITGNLDYIRSDDAFGEIWPAPTTVMSDDNAGRHSCLLYVEQRPAVAHIQQYNAATIFYQRSADATGSDWSGAGSITESFVGNGFGGAESSMAIVSGNPAICFYDKNGQDLRFHRALNAQGSSWGAEQILDDTLKAGRYCSMAAAGGKAFIVYYVESANEFRAVHAQDGSALNWDTPLLIDAVVTSFPDAAVVDGKPAAAYIRGNTPYFAIRY